MRLLPLRLFWFGGLLTTKKRATGLIIRIFVGGVAKCILVPVTYRPTLFSARGRHGLSRCSGYTVVQPVPNRHTVELTGPSTPLVAHSMSRYVSVTHSSSPLLIDQFHSTYLLRWLLHSDIQTFCRGANPICVLAENTAVHAV